MARPTTKPRLAQLDPETMAMQAQENLLDHLQKVAERLGYDLIPTITTGTPSGIETTLIALCRYAQTGALEGDLEELPKTVLHVMDTFFSTPFATSREADALAPETPLELVLVAAVGRFRMGVGALVTARHVGALAGFDEQHIRRLARQKDLAIRDGKIPASEARRWLAAQGVMGFGPTDASRLKKGEMQ